jgi:hypothetical protein
MDQKRSPTDLPPAYSDTQTGTMANPFLNPVQNVSVPSSGSVQSQSNFVQSQSNSVQSQSNSIQSNNTIDFTRFDQLVRQHELNAAVATQLKDVLSKCVVVLLCDDSDSMNRPIAEEGTDPFAPKRSTRWLELKKLASNLIEIITAVNPNGLDIHFLNRPTLKGVNSTAGLQNAFGIPPTGGTPLIGKISSIFREYDGLPRGQQLLLICITDGEPTDPGMSRNDLFNVLVNKKDNVHVSFAECTDQSDDMDYLDQWDGVIQRFDNTDDYREELARVKNVQGQQFKFDYMDYVVKILLATFVRWYFNLDQIKVNDPRTNGGSNYVPTIFQPPQTAQYNQQNAQQYNQQSNQFLQQYTQGSSQAQYNQSQYNQSQSQSMYQSPQQNGLRQPATNTCCVIL